MAKEISIDGKTTKQERDLLESLDRLNELTGKQISVRHRFLLGMIQGVGTAIGATILAGILFAFLAWTFRSASDIPWLSDLVDQINWEQVLINTESSNTNELPQSTETESTQQLESNQSLTDSLDRLNENLEKWQEANLGKTEVTENENIETEENLEE